MCGLIRFLAFFFIFVCAIMGGCAAPQDTAYVDDSGAGEREASGKSISSSDVSVLISDARTELGTYGGACKVWVQETVSWSYGVTIPSTDASPSSDQYKWYEDSTATNVARWLGSYANGRYGSSSTSLARGTSTATSISVPNSDPQSIVIYASTTTVTATLAKGSSSLSVTSTGGAGGTVSSSTVIGSGTWTLTVRNTGTATASGVVVVVLSYSRFQSDWQTARVGDIMQMYVGTGRSSRSTGGPHTTFVQTNYNTNGTTSSTGTCKNGQVNAAANSSGCNWLDSNWITSGTVWAHNISMNDMMLMAAYSSSYGFTIYRLN